jgi:hypothetical protein
MRLLLLGLFVMSMAIAYGQKSESNKNWQFGVNGGMLTGSVSSSNSSFDFSPKKGFKSGMSATYFFNESFALGTGIEFERRGFTSKVFNSGLQITDNSYYYICLECYYASEVDYQSFYLTFPLFVEYHWLMSDISIFVKGGIYYSLMLKTYQDGYEEMYIDNIAGLPFIKYGFEPGQYRNYFIGNALDVANTYDGGILVGLGISYLLQKNIGVFVDASLQTSVVGYFENPEMVMIQVNSSMFRGGLFYRMDPKKNRNKQVGQQNTKD